MLGEIVMGGAASLLICMFLGPRFIDYLRLKEFGQQISQDKFLRLGAIADQAMTVPGAQL